MTDLKNLIEFVGIPAGKFMMGSPDDEAKRYDDEGPQHQVVVPAFQMGKFPVTQKQWRAVAELPRIRVKIDPDPSSFKGERRPVENISWHEAVEFCQRLSAYTGLNYRLPAEAEWEYACRATSTTPFNCGGELDGHANAGLNTHSKTAEVGLYQPNAFGLYDMHGNVWEWCEDIWHENYKGAPIDGRAWLDSGVDNWRVIRGGSWSSVPRYCRSAYRNHDDPDDQFYDIGFRVVLAPR